MRLYPKLLRTVGLFPFVWAMLGTGRVSMAQNLKWGPFQGSGGFTLGSEFIDNANTSHDHAKGDVLLTIGPTLNGGVYLPFAGGEQFTLTMAATYVQSLAGVSPDSFGAPMTAALILPVYVAKWTVVASDTFNFTNDPLQNTFAVNRSTIEEYLNTANISATRQFGKFSTTFAVQRQDYIYPSVSSQGQTDYQFSFTPSLMLQEGYSVFVRTAYGLNYVVGSGLQDSTAYSIDFGVNGQITPSLSGTIELGWTYDHLSATGTNKAQNINGVDSNVTLSYTHPLRPNTTHSISFYRSPGVSLLLLNSSLTQATGVNYTISHRLNRNLTLSPTVGWVHLVSLYGPTTLETADLIQVGFGLQRTFTKHLVGTFSYLHQTRDSSITANNYDVNEVTVNAIYTF